MRDAIKKIMVTVISAAIVGTGANQFVVNARLGIANERLAKLEAKVEVLLSDRIASVDQPKPTTDKKL